VCANELSSYTERVYGVCESSEDVQQSVIKPYISEMTLIVTGQRADSTSLYEKTRSTGAEIAAC